MVKKIKEKCLVNSEEADNFSELIECFSFFSLQIQGFLQFVKNIYANLPNYLHKIFELRQQIKVKDITEVNVDVYLQEIFTITTIITDKKNADNQSVSVS